MRYAKQLGPTTYGRSSRARLATCTNDLQRVFKELANDGWDISILCGERTEEAQNEAFSKGNSKAKYPMSKHNQSPSMAVDAAPYISGHSYTEIANDDTPWIILAGRVLEKAQELGIKIRWGGLFKGLKDLGHFELED